MTRFTYTHIVNALSDMQREGLIERLPYGVAPPLRVGANRWPVEGPFTEADWTPDIWNPPLNHAKPDPTASPQPTWAAMLPFLRKWRLIALDWEHSNYGNDVSTRTERIATEAVAHRHASAAVEVGPGGIDHATALIKHGADSAAAGLEWPAAVMRDKEGGVVTFYSADEADELVSAMAFNKNRASSAGNIVRAKLDKLRAAALDETGGLPATATDEERLTARETALFAFQAMMTDLDTHFAAALKEFDGIGDKLPEDNLDRTKDVLLRRLSIYANRRRNEIVDANGRQDPFFEAACNEQYRALEAISQARQAVNRNIREADTVAKAKTAYQTGLHAIVAIPTDNAPIWTDTDDETLIPGRGGYVHMPVPQTTGNRRPTVSFKVRNPSQEELKDGRKTADLLGPPTVFLAPGTRGWGISVGRADDAGVRTVTLTWGRTVPLTVGTVVEARGQNSCGIEPIRIRFSEPAPTESSGS